MKRYLLLLRSSDFVKEKNVWTTSYINLYNNNSYSNYSYTRSSGGLNLIGDRTYVGIDVTSPNFNIEQATPISLNAIYVTDVGEIVYDSATPTLLRFLDTSSKIDLINYRYIFTNLPGEHVPGFSIQLYESNYSIGPWMKTVYGGDSGTILSSDVKPYIRIELTLDDQGIDLSSVGLIFYLEVAIHDIVPENISKSAREILDRFPSWTKLYEDSYYGATPSLDVPKSTGGKMINALSGMHLDDLERRVDLTSINSYINSADENMTAWVYSSYNIPANTIKVEGDSVVLARVSNFSDLINLRTTDYAYYIDNAKRELVTNRQFDVLKVDGIPVNQEPINVYNSFDEFGARMGVPRLYLENNSNYKKRILDASKNISGVTKKALQMALRRELDIWRAYGATPDSDYNGATPEILEIEDIQNSTPYFSKQGHPHEIFRNLIEDINIKYPSNIGYVNWGEGIWDYGGLIGQGLSRIPAIYDDLVSVSEKYYKPGIGDFDDAKLQFDYLDSATINFNGLIGIEGYQSSGYRDIYAPITVPYTVRLGYSKNAIQVGDPCFFVYEVFIENYGVAATPSTFYVNLNRNSYQGLVHSNTYSPSHSASPEFTVFEIFDNDGYTVEYLNFRNKINNESYISYGTTPVFNRIFFEDVDTASIVNGSQWDQGSQSYFLAESDLNYKYSYSTSTPYWHTYNNPGLGWVESRPSIYGDAGDQGYFGYSIDISSDGLRIAAGAGDSLANSGAGTVRVFDWDGSTWVQAGSDIDGEAADDRFGYGISLSSDGNRLAVGASSNDGNGVDSGHVRVFDWDGSAWIQVGSDIDGEAANDRSGFNVVLSSDGNRLAVGATRNDGNGVDSGHVRVFDWDGSTWVQAGSDIDGEAAGDRFSWSLDLSSNGNRLAVGAYGNDDNGTNSGHVRVFDWDGSAWIQVGSDIDGKAAYDDFGDNLSLSSDGNRLAVGAPYTETNEYRGRVAVYDWDGSSWVQAGLDLNGEVAYDYFGAYVVLSSDGTYLIVGSPYLERDGLTIGRVTTFNWDGSNWVKVGSDIVGEIDRDFFGERIAISSNSLNLAVSAGGYNSNDGKVRFFDWSILPSYLLNTVSLSTPNFKLEDLDLLIGSNIYSSTPVNFLSEPIKREIILNSLGGYGDYDLTSFDINIMTQIETILIPPSATPHSIYVDVVKDTLTGVHGGVSYDPVTAERYFIPSSPGISCEINLDSTPYSVSYFESSTLNYNSTPSVLVKSLNTSYYPIKARSFESFYAETTPNLYSGYVDAFGNAYKAGEDPINAYFNDDTLVGSYYLSLDSFNLSENSYRVIEKILFLTDNYEVINYTDDLNSLKSDLESAFLNNEEILFNVHAELDPYLDRDYTASIGTGLININNEDQYIYVDPILDTFSNSTEFEHVLTSIPKYGSPLILKVGSDDYRNVFFQDPATPEVHSFVNTEIIYGNKYNTIHLAYNNVYIHYVKDLFLGENIFFDLDVSGYSFEPFSEATPMINGRAYEVSYTVKNAYYIDKDFYNTSSDSYHAKLYISSTPNTPQDYLLTYENSKDNTYLPIDLRIDSIENPLDEGFVYVDITEKDFGQADIYLSPKNISDNPKDLMYLTIVSRDINGNIKPNQGFNISSSSLSATPSYVITNDNGIAKSILRYSGVTPSILSEDFLLIEGDDPATPPSDTYGFSATVNYSIQISTEFIVSIKAVPLRFYYSKGEGVYVNIFGQVYWRDKPLLAEIDINWYTADTLYDIFATPNYKNSGTLTTNSDGSFEIINEISTDLTVDSGSRFTAIEVADPDALRSIVGSLGEVLHDNLITIGGDIVYWTEIRDASLSYNEDPVMNSAVRHIKYDNSDLYSTPNFVYRHNDSDLISFVNSSYNWKPPRWVPLSRYEQYQMGILGSTPNTISYYGQIHPDSSEQ